MRLLLDTSAFVRWMDGSPLPRSVERLLARRSTELVISMVTAWEIVLKAKLGRSSADIEAAIGRMSAVLLPIKFEHLEELSHLPLVKHRDPFDRLLIAQALAEDLTIVTSDTRFEGYRRVRVLWK